MGIGGNVLAAVVVMAFGTLIALNEPATRQDDSPSLADLAFVTDDCAAPAPGCDAIVVVDLRTGEHVFDGRQMVSPGRLAISSGAKWILSQSNNSGPFIAAARLISDAQLTWASSSIGAPIAEGAPAEISPDDESVVITYSNRIARYALADVRPTSVGRQLATLSVSGVSGLVFTSDSSRLVVIRTDGTIDVADAHSLVPIHEGIAYAPFNVPAPRRLRQTFAAITKDDRYLLVSTGRSDLNVIDLVQATSARIDLPDIQESYGVAVDYAADRDIFAIHGGSIVAVFELVNGGRARSMGSVAVPEQVPERGTSPPGDEAQRFRVGSLAWTARGDGLVAAIGGRLEFRVLDVEQQEDVVRLAKRLDFEGCDSPRPAELALDVVTLNRRLGRPHPTTIIPSATALSPSATPTGPDSPTPPPPTATPSPPPTSTAPIGSTPTPTISVVRLPTPLYVPVSLRERCTPAYQHTDVALVIDTSTSMRDVDASGIAKLDAAVAAARTFVALLALGGGDQAAIVQFNHDAELLQALTGDRAAIDAAFAAIHVQSETCLVCGVEAAAAELASARRRAGNTAVMVVLTDGRSNPRPASEAEAAAGRAKAAGVTVFTIGLGEDVDAEALAAMAAPGGRFYRAPSAGELGGIYAEVAGAIPCPAGAFWGGR